MSIGKLTMQDRIEIFTMVVGGISVKQIAEKFGVSRQTIYDVIYYKRPRRRMTICKIKFLGIRNFLIKNNLSIRGFARLITDSKVPNQIYMKLKGEREFRYSEIVKILDVTGMTFEEAFAKDKINYQEEGTNDG